MEQEISAANFCKNLWKENKSQISVTLAFFNLSVTKWGVEFQRTGEDETSVILHRK